MTCDVTLCRGGQEVAHDVPQRVLGLHALTEGEGARAVGRASSKAVAHRRQTALHLQQTTAV
jgi:hypothetical protein